MSGLLSTDHSSLSASLDCYTSPVILDTPLPGSLPSIDRGICYHQRALPVLGVLVGQLGIPMLDPD